jgi:hypothetical protein
VRFLFVICLPEGNWNSSVWRLGNTGSSHEEEREYLSCCKIIWIYPNHWYLHILAIKTNMTQGIFRQRIAQEGWTVAVLSSEEQLLGLPDTLHHTTLLARWFLYYVKL